MTGAARLLPTRRRPDKEILARPQASTGGPDNQEKKLEARVGIEPTNGAFAEPCLTTWLPRLNGPRPMFTQAARRCKRWSRLGTRRPRANFPGSQEIEARGRSKRLAFRTRRTAVGPPVVSRYPGCPSRSAGKSAPAFAPGGTGNRPVPPGDPPGGVAAGCPPAVAPIYQPACRSTQRPCRLGNPHYGRPEVYPYAAGAPASPPAPVDSAGQPAHSIRFAPAGALELRGSAWSAAACCRFSARVERATGPSRRATRPAA